MYKDVVTETREESGVGVIKSVAKEQCSFCVSDGGSCWVA
jgi:hypothetical protein